ncbi:MAG: YdaU family protein, partial [Patescibacteria group bacterium]|nr:YdaU family protein [Patescibacteria group bacterium]
MNYYQHHIGDFMRDTAHLSAVEDGIYRRALDWYYANEKPLPADIKLICRYLRARDKTEIAAVNIILSEFFVLTDEGYTQSRCDKEIALYNDKVKTNRVNGKKGGRPKKETQSNPTTNQQETQSVISGLNSETQIKGNQEPITINQEPIIKIHTQNAREDFSPNLEKLNDMLKRSGSKPIEQAHLEQALVTFNPHYEHYELTENQRYA